MSDFALFGLDKEVYILRCGFELQPLDGHILFYFSNCASAIFDTLQRA